MGSIGFNIGLASAPAAPEALAALHRDAWEIVASRMARLASRGASEEILSHYLHFQEQDGFHDGSWSADDDALSYTFGDSAGLCVVEMHASLHWARLASLDRWAALSALAEQHGGRLTPPSGGDAEQLLRGLLTGRSTEVFFFWNDTKLGHTAAAPAPGDDHEIRFYDNESDLVPLSGLGEDRNRITGMIRAGQCSCDACQTLRWHRDLPRAQEFYDY